MGVALGPVVDELQGVPEDAGPVGEVVVDERGRHPRLRCQFLHPEAADAAARDHSGGCFQKCCSTV
jgi:hypothetical protein